jgi:hypothetical protein
MDKYTVRLDKKGNWPKCRFYIEAGTVNFGGMLHRAEESA